MFIVSFFISFSFTINHFRNQRVTLSVVSLLTINVMCLYYMLCLMRILCTSFITLPHCRLLVTCHKWTCKSKIECMYEQCFLTLMLWFWICCCDLHLSATVHDRQKKHWEKEWIDLQQSPLAGMNSCFCTCSGCFQSMFSTNSTSYKLRW